MKLMCTFCGDTYSSFDVAHVCSKGSMAPKIHETNTDNPVDFPESEEFDVVIKALSDYRKSLWKMTRWSPEWGIMDSIRLEQIDRLDCAIACWNKHKGEWVDE